MLVMCTKAPLWLRPLQQAVQQLDQQLQGVERCCQDVGIPSTSRQNCHATTLRATRTRTVSIRSTSPRGAVAAGQVRVVDRRHDVAVVARLFRAGAMAIAKRATVALVPCLVAPCHPALS